MTTATLPQDPMLVPERDAPYRVGKVYEKLVDGLREEIVLAFDGASLSLRCDPDTDALETHFADETFQVTRDYRPLIGTVLDKHLGAEFGWSWLAVNQQGYADSVMLSFAGVIPSVLIHSTGSTVKVMVIDSQSA
jgi:hypothetical protein